MPSKIGQKYNIEPKPKIKEVFDKMVKDGKPMNQAMIESGFSKNYVSTKLKKTKSWDILLKREIKDEKLISVLNEGLDATKQSGTGGMLLDTEKGQFGHTDIQYPDYPTRHKYLETGLKLKNYFPKDSPTTAVQVNINRFKDYE